MIGHHSSPIDQVKWRGNITAFPITSSGACLHPIDDRINRAIAPLHETVRPMSWAE